MNVKEYDGLFYQDGRFTSVRDNLSVEVGLHISVNQVPFTVTMQTPGYEKDLVRGLLFSENIFRETNSDPVMRATSFDDEGFITGIEVSIPPHQVLKEFAGTRNVISASSCGLCGKTSLDDDVCREITEPDHLDPAVVGVMFDRMSASQQSFQRSGGTHAAGLFTVKGEMISLREDIGRHNAVDKVIGDMLHRRMLDQAKCLTVSGRISYEIVSKARSAGIPYLASVSAPSTLAVDYAQSSGITLMAFCRNHKLTVYSQVGRVKIPGQMGEKMTVKRIENV